MASGDTKTEALLNILGSGGDASEYRGCCNTKSQNYILDAIDRVQKVEDDVEEIKNNPDVVDIVATYADLQAYDTQHLTDNDIIRVLQDETHNDNSTYYRFTKNPDTWTFIGEISGGGPTVVQTTGTSTTDVMSQKAVTDTLFKDNNTAKVQIGSGADASGGASYYTAVAIGSDAKATGDYGTAVGSTGCTASGDSAVAIGRSSAKAKGAISIGRTAEATSAGSIAIGGYSGSSNNAYASYNGSIAIGVGSMTTVAGEFNIGDRSSTYGYNSSAYRLLSGLYDGQTAHDAATLAQGNTLATSAPTTSTVGVLGQLYTDTTNMHTYQCTAINGSQYTWTQRW